ncbi:MAG TPA: hypothetical protein VGZ47_14870 [Gemmataceae bacterium]|jgi:hypothetical protein|nr:hypothetical protein [Gemmataceae bacterium]
MKFLMTARDRAGEIMRAEFEADDEAQARDLIQQADSSLELISLEPVNATEEVSTPAPSTPSDSSPRSYGKRAGWLGGAAIIVIALKLLLLGLRCTQNQAPRQPLRPQPDPLQQKQELNRVVLRINQTSKLADSESALHQRMQQTDDKEVRDNCRRALDEIAKLKALRLNGSDEEWENKRQAVRTALAVALPPNAPAKGAAKTTPGTATKN